MRFLEFPPSLTLKMRIKVHIFYAHKLRSRTKIYWCSQFFFYKHKIELYMRKFHLLCQYKFANISLCFIESTRDTKFIRFCWETVSGYIYAMNRLSLYIQRKQTKFHLLLIFIFLVYRSDLMQIFDGATVSKRCRELFRDFRIWSWGWIKLRHNENGIASSLQDDTKILKIHLGHKKFRENPFGLEVQCINLFLPFREQREEIVYWFTSSTN